MYNNIRKPEKLHFLNAKRTVLLKFVYNTYIFNVPRAGGWRKRMSMQTEADAKRTASGFIHNVLYQQSERFYLRTWQREPISIAEGDAGCFFKPSLTPTFPLITPLPLPPSLLLSLSRLLALCLSPPLSPRSVSLWAQTLPCLTPIGWEATNLASGRAGGTAYAKPCFILMSSNRGFKSLIRRVQELLVPTGCAYRLSPGERSC